MSDAHISSQDLVAALRFTADEVQLTRVLHAVCKEPKAAKAFLRAVLKSAGRTDVEIPAKVRVTTEEEFEAHISRLDRKNGRTDLRFTAAGWDCVVECKVNDRLTEQQARKNLAIGSDYAIFLGRREPTGLSKRITGHPSYGFATWHAVAPALRRLRLADPNARETWRSIVAELEEQGDFDPVPPEGTPASRAGLKQLEIIASDLEDALRRSVKRAYAGATGAQLAALVASEANVMYNGPRAYLRLGFECDELLDVAFWIALAKGGTAGPTLEISALFYARQRSSRAMMALRARPGWEFDRASYSMTRTFKAEITNPSAERRRALIVRCVQAAIKDVFDAGAHKDWDLEDLLTDSPWRS